jgi:hypothetical protein
LRAEAGTGFAVTQICSGDSPKFPVWCSSSAESFQALKYLCPGTYDAADLVRSGTKVLIPIALLYGAVGDGDHHHNII